jgi:hypothetical protein
VPRTKQVPMTNFISGNGTLIMGLSAFGFPSNNVSIGGGTDTQIVGDFLGVNALGDETGNPEGNGVRVSNSTGNTIGGLVNSGGGFRQRDQRQCRPRHFGCRRQHDLDPAEPDRH